MARPAKGRVKLSLIAGGSARGTPEGALTDDWLKRFGGIARKLGVSEVTLTEIPERKAHDPKLWLAAMPDGAYTIAADEHGKSLASTAFASLLQKRIEAAKPLAFVIGAADGLLPEVKARAQALISFGAQTMPHLLVRAILAEQLYRAATILTGHPYHRP